jgi:hypothetical protein
MTLKHPRGAAFLTINGIQTMSAQTYNLLAQMPELLAMGIDIVRISPQPQAHGGDHRRLRRRPPWRIGRTRHRRLGAEGWSTATGSASRHRPAPASALAQLEGA